MSRSSTRPAAGFTLLELMIAMAIGLLLTVLVAQLFVNTRQTYATTDDVSRMQENMRVASEVIVRTVRTIGYMSAPNTYQVATDGYPGVFTFNPALQATEGRAYPDSDSLTARFEGSGATRLAQDNAIVDCLGNPSTAGVISENTFTVEFDPATNARGLFCRTSPTTQGLIAPYVENMQILYGEDTNGDTNADHFGTISDVVPTRVVAIRIALLFRTPNAGLRPSPDTTTYNLNGVTIPAFNDTYLRRPMTMTVALRNRTS